LVLVVRKYAQGDTELKKLEKEARDARKGLWADPQPVPPWEWRKRRDASSTGLAFSRPPSNLRALFLYEAIPAV
jgi:hypothetical protein